MPAPSLFDIAKHRIIQNIEMLTDVGDLPYDFLRPILLKVEIPDQLRLIEENSPQIQGEDGEIWLRYIKRDIQNWQKKPHQPKEPKSWWKVYRKLKNDAEVEKQAQEDALRASLKALQDDKATNKTMIVDAKLGFDPAKRRKVPTHSGFVSGFGSSSVPAKNAKTAIDRLKRSMYEQKVARPKGSLMPTHLLEERKGRVMIAPKSMVERIQTAKEPPKTMLVPRKGSFGRSLGGSSSQDDSALAARESRLKAFTESRPATATSPPPRASLPTDKAFKAPQLASRPSPDQASAMKRKRPAPNIFMPQKKRARE